LHFLPLFFVGEVIVSPHSGIKRAKFPETTRQNPDERVLRGIQLTINGISGGIEE
jgi:hypothetical protein